jgi:hypothetical protein
MTLHPPKLWSVLWLGALMAFLRQACWAQASGDAAPAPALVLTNPLCQLAPGDALRFFRDPTRQATLPQVVAKPPGAWSVFKPGPPTSFGSPCAKSNCYPRRGIVVPKGCYPMALVFG